MDVINNCVPETKTGLSELIQYLPSRPVGDSATSLRIRGNTSGTKTDILEAVKLDPAVMEAQITIDTSSSVLAKTECYDSPSKDVKEVVVKRELPSNVSGFERMMSMQQAALLSLSPQLFQLLLKFTDTLRIQRRHNQMSLECAFCKNNGDPVSWYSSHALKNWRGKVRCPVLRAHKCPRCGATGDHAHTIKYCPENFPSENIARNMSSDFEGGSLPSVKPRR